MTETDSMVVRVAKVPTVNELNGRAIGMRNRGQFYHGGDLGGNGPIYLGDWLKREFERYGYDLKDMARL